jgi:hypothetical protein
VKYPRLEILATVSPVPEVFAVCSMCRKPISVGAKYYRCSVSTCNSGRIKLAFCTVGCWDAHLPTARHRNASAIEETAQRQG